MKRKTLCLAAVLAAALTGNHAFAQGGRDYISIVGSSTVYPFATVVAERFGRTTGFKTPKIESTGSGGGLKLFCEGVGVATPDITNASRRIKQSEVEKCQSNGVKEIVEVKIGYDGIAIAHARRKSKLEGMTLSLKEIYLALAKEVPDPKGGDKLVGNPYGSWNEINSDLPKVKIEVLGPPPTSGTRDAFVELAMEEGCQEIPSIKALKEKDEDEFKRVCHTMREDGAFIEAGENDNLIVQKLVVNPSALGIFGFSFLDQNTDRIAGVRVDGVAPEFEKIASGDYPVSRPLYFYVKKAHIGMIPGLKEYIAEFTSDKAWGDEGYLSDRGLVPMPEEEREQVKAAVEKLKPLSLAGGK